MPSRFLAAMALLLALMCFVTYDQMHWWRVKPDYAFGWLVPVFVVYIIVNRWRSIKALLRANTSPGRTSWLSPVANFVVFWMWVAGVAFFLLGAFYQTSAGVSQPGSLALALGFAGLALGLVYFNTPAGVVRWPLQADGGEKVGDRRRLLLGLFIFPALIWIISAPLVTAVENSLSLFLLQHVVKIVYNVFNFLGFPLLQDGNVLVLPRGQVGVVDACSGIRSLTGCVFAGAFLGAVFLSGPVSKLLLLVAAVTLAFATNLLRSLFLTGWAYAYGSDAIEGPVHDYSGFAVLGLTSVGLFALLPLFHSRKAAPEDTPSAA